TSLDCFVFTLIKAINRFLLALPLPPLPPPLAVFEAIISRLLPQACSSASSSFPSTTEGDCQMVSPLSTVQMHKEALHLKS
ncbi:mCG1044066, partial [Mus musculus]